MHANEFHRVLGALALQAGHALGHFVGVAQEAPNGVVHGRDLSGHLHAQCASHLDHRAGQGPRLVEGGHEGGATAFDVEHQAFQAFCEFLGHDRGGDEPDLRDRGGHVASGVEDAVSRCNPFGLAADEAGIGAHLIEAEPRVESGNGLELVDGAPGVRQPAAGQHGHDQTCGREAWRKDEAHLVANPSGGVLVHAAR